ncbi:hypothetical protein FisN_8Hh195 [Fistulifera solaris]|uniref:Uncharacterized protein n=1 Tax=Fistulifera solaris TaxID=1519565 RepID=A0A1Z5JY91_FISSO|nr:hypothetical protein FisN_8Hh195 [Fistulifera solaris]|eukprot:GAX18974.1 hypothetical protein FisN_8Hh195 [Fistulifera solaris]
MKRSINCCVLIVASLLVSSSAFSTPQRPIGVFSAQQTRRSHLFAKQYIKERPKLFSRVSKSFRRRCKLTGASLLFAASVFLAPPKPAHASAAPSAVLESILEKTSPSLDTIIDRYVKEHMFNDDTYDPIESAYREAYDDAVHGTYPQALREVTGVGAASTETPTNSNPVSNVLSKIDLGAMLTSMLTFIKNKLQLNETSAIMVLAAIFVVGGPFAFLFTGMVIGGMSKRNMNRLMKKRYGDSYTLDATMKTEETVEAPDDDDDDEEEGENDSANDDEDDEDDE